MGLFGLHWGTKTALVRLAQTYLDPGERIDHLLVGSRGWVMPRWMLVVTERAIVVIEIDVNMGAWLVRPFRDVPRLVLPRKTRLGPIEGRGWILVDGEELLLMGPNDRETIAAIDAEAGFSNTV